MRWAAALRQEIIARNQKIAALNQSVHELSDGDLPNVIYGADAKGQHGNFYPASYRNICANPQWARRLAKAHPGSRRVIPRSAWRWRELDCANSSDALLMNVFCYQPTLRNRELCSMLGVAPGQQLEFGFKPGVPLSSGKTDRTEIDLKFGDLLVEAKLTETDFQTAPAWLIERYRDTAEVFDIQALGISEGVVRNYQLIRGVLAAHAADARFCVLCDARRPDLIDDWHSVMLRVKCYSLRCRLQLLTWQELTAVLPKTLQRFLAVKYGVTA
jgi:hypothetical protein